MRVLILFLLIPFFACGQIQVGDARLNDLSENHTIVTGAERLDRYLPLLDGQSVGVVGNHTSMIGDTHLVDVLISRGVTVKAILSPEHGFRGEAANGEKVEGSIDAKTGLEVRSLYGKTKKPTEAMLQDISVLVFDMQDVGARFYTYLSTLHYVMEAAAEQGKKVIVLDRPNPNGFYVDGPVLDLQHQSFVGMHAIPIVHGMTLGELAMMINNEGWLDHGVRCDLEVIACENYRHSDLYRLPVNPSPNLSSMEAVYLYPSLCLFEATIVSVGRGTPWPFEVYGHPSHQYGSFTFTPSSTPGKSKHPKYEGQECSGQRLTEFGSFYFHANKQLYLGWLLSMYETTSDPALFFTSSNFFDKLAGTSELRKQIIAGLDEKAIRASWQEELDAFKQLRQTYLLYPEY